MDGCCVCCLCLCLILDCVLRCRLGETPHLYFSVSRFSRSDWEVQAASEFESGTASPVWHPITIKLKRFGALSLSSLLCRLFICLHVC
jgi:hypothetical protein